MLKQERHRRILELLDQHGAISQASLRDHLPVTVMTIWRDLDTLETEGRLRRVRGGAVRPDHVAEPAFRQKVRQAVDEKRRIARHAAAEFVSEGDVLILEGGTTVAELLPCLTAPALTILTNSLPILSRAHAVHHGPALHSSGGMLSEVSGNFVGAEAIRFFRRKRAHTFFMSATGLDLASARLTDPNPVEIAVKRAMAAAAERVVLLLDASKFHALSLEEVLPLGTIDTVVTDRRITPAQRRRLRALGPKVLTV